MRNLWRVSLFPPGCEAAPLFFQIRQGLLRSPAGASSLATGSVPLQLIDITRKGQIQKTKPAPCKGAGGVELKLESRTWPDADRSSERPGCWYARLQRSRPPC